MNWSTIIASTVLGTSTVFCFGGIYIGAITLMFEVGAVFGCCKFDLWSQRLISYGFYDVTLVTPAVKD